MSGNDRVLGIVENGKFQRVAPLRDLGGPTKLTSLPPHAAQGPVSGALDFSGHAGSAIIVTGHDQREWSISAEVIDQAGPILTAVVKQVLGDASKGYYP
jgi:hypothetical protein